MAKNKEQKQDTVKILVNGLKNAKAVVFANFQGLTVEKSQDLRGKCRAEGISVLASKKTLVKRACDELKLEGANPTEFSGGVATFLAQDETSAARIVNNFAKDNKLVEIFGGVLENKYIGEAEVKNLANLPTKDELLAKVVGTINAPISGFVNALAGNLRNLVGVLSNIKEAKS